jgi:hypothetical protein
VYEVIGCMITCLQDYVNNRHNCGFKTVFTGFLTCVPNI